MSETDSFIDEVNEEVRRDRLYAALRRYGWIAIVAVLAIVGGAAFNEYRRASDLALAQQRGDAILQALEPDTGESRSAALGEISTEGSAVSALVGLFRRVRGLVHHDDERKGHRTQQHRRRDGVAFVFVVRHQVAHEFDRRDDSSRRALLRRSERREDKVWKIPPHRNIADDAEWFVTDSL